MHLVTQARRSMSDDIAYRQRRYLLMMGIRALCFVIAVVLYTNHFGCEKAIAQGFSPALTRVPMRSSRGP